MDRGVIVTFWVKYANVLGRLYVRKLTVILESDDASFDEPVRETIMRDLREVAHKFRHVIAPQKEVCQKKIKTKDQKCYE